ncbi:MAG: hypothetical protein JO027_04820 [Solirubrobacterales bacterium]|nr:hypothetical protein [Solirubrobacterales bacterium]
MRRRLGRPGLGHGGREHVGVDGRHRHGFRDPGFGLDRLRLDLDRVRDQTAR